MRTLGVLLTAGLMLSVDAKADANAGGATDAPAVRVYWDGDTCVHEQGDWVLRIEYLNKGTRSEGQNGVLLKHGTEVKARQDGETLETPLGLLKWYGSERKKLWDVTGWNFADRKRIRHSDRIQTTQPPKTEPPKTAEP